MGTSTGGVPSVVTIKKGEVTYIGKVDRAKYTIRELTRRAMQDVGRYITANVRKNLRSAFPFTSARKNSQRYQMWVKKREAILVVGMENVKHGAKTAWWADQLEQDKFIYTPPRKKKKRKIVLDSSVSKTQKSAKTMGTRYFPRRHLLDTFVKGHIAKIVEIESKYLAYMENEAAALSAISDTAGKEINE